MTQRVSADEAIAEIGESIRELVKACRIMNARLKALEQEVERQKQERIAYSLET